MLKIKYNFKTLVCGDREQDRDDSESGRYIKSVLRRHELQAEKLLNVSYRLATF